MSKKDNFSQAMFEMFGFGKPEDGEEEAGLEAELTQLENFVPAEPAEPQPETPAAEEPSFAEAPAVSEKDVPFAEVTATSFEQPPAFTPAPEPVPAPAPTPAPAPVSEPVSYEAPQPKHAYVRRENCTYFAPGTSMEGTLRSDSDVEIVGDFKGEIASDGKVTIHSNTQSSIAAAELVLVDCTLTGDAMVSGDVSINESSSVSGNVRAANIVCSGIVKGNLNVQGNITLTENAQVIGDIKTGTLAMSRGAKVSGKIDMGGN
jgi:cytoskeletal protein CcmA (bactofilin family)